MNRRLDRETLETATLIIAVKDLHADPGPHQSATGQLESMVKRCLMSSDVGLRIRDKLRPMPKYGSINLHVHGSQKAR